ncbi:MAG: hypothetical protein ABSC06_30585 [Rhodopila sp.]|jgi:hypothetical protein
MRQALSSLARNRKPRSIRSGFHAAPAIRSGDDRVVPLISEEEPEPRGEGNQGTGQSGLE